MLLDGFRLGFLPTPNEGPNLVKLEHLAWQVAKMLALVSRASLFGLLHELHDRLLGRASDLWRNED
jgi:hypothetical protein